ncbi:MAG TPA: hypothetical protein VH277_02620, partial [Gemmatimonadaceae bacterium]|nr:hypothetical protein [Gemmatimonadaceae bacterium]
LDRQARAVAQSFPTTVNGTKFTTVSGYWENGQFWRLRELSATIQMPQTLAARIRARDADLVLAGRNLAWWGAYTGVDPESNYAAGTGVGNSIPQDFLTTAPRRYLEVRLNLHY